MAVVKADMAPFQLLGQTAQPTPSGLEAISLLVEKGLPHPDKSYAEAYSVT